MSKTIAPHRLIQSSYPFQHVIETQFGDMDIAAHVNNVAIARYYEHARARFLEAMFGRDYFQRRGPLRNAVAELNLRYLRDIHYPDPVTAGVGIGHLGNTSFVVHSALFHNGACVGVCDCVMVRVNNEGPIRIADDYRATMATMKMRETTDPC